MSKLCFWYSIFSFKSDFLYIFDWARCWIARNSFFCHKCSFSLYILPNFNGSGFGFECLECAIKDLNVQCHLPVILCFFVLCWQCALSHLFFEAFVLYPCCHDLLQFFRYCCSTGMKNNYRNGFFPCSRAALDLDLLWQNHRLHHLMQPT